MVEGFTFLSPWVLSALAVVPVLWWLLRVMPPRAKTVRFPAFFLLQGIETQQKSAAHMPWWLLLLRITMAVLLILSFAEPVLHPVQNMFGSKKGDVLMIVDNGWASANRWQERLDKMREYLQHIRRNGNTVTFLPTAPAAEDGRIHFYGAMNAAEAEEWLHRLKPQPWPTAPADTAPVAEEVLRTHQVAHTILFSDGLATSADLLKRAETVVTDERTNNPYILRTEEQKQGPLDFTLERLHPVSQGQPLQLLAWSNDGAVLDQFSFTFPAGEKEYAFSWDILPEVRQKTARLSLREPAMASAVFLAQARWRQYPVGIIADDVQKESRDFLSEVYYLRRALEENSQLTVEPLTVLLQKNVSALVLPDSIVLTPEEKQSLAEWVAQGGFLIRFAGPHLAAQPEDEMLPVPLRFGQRAMEGAMTWEKPVRLGDIASQSPLYGLSVSQDITVTRQVLANPTPEVFEKTWLQLEDGTPLITGDVIGKGTVVLVHTSAGPDWSNFCYSGLFVEALQRMVSLSNGIRDYKPQTVLPPLMLMDGFGQLRAPDHQAIVTSLQPGQEFAPSPQTPPGLYGDAHEFKAFNLGDTLLRMQPLKDIPSSSAVVSYQKDAEVDLQPAFLKAALLLLLVDTVLTLWLRGVVAIASVLLGVMIFSAPAHAAVDEKDLISGLYLAYIETGDQDIDRTSYNGLTGLGEVISARTSAKIKGIVGINPDDTALAYYPLIYWPMSDRQMPLSMTAARRLQNYLSQGGMILMDTRDQQFGGDGTVAGLGTRKMRELTQNMQIPELTTVPKDHILTRSFYLLDDFPGRYTGGKLWVEKEPNPHHDAVTSVVIGSNDWAAAWSKDPNDRTRFMVEPGGESQREMAYRFGINLVMVALTGNYKADQVHIPYILDRIGQ